MAHQIDTDSFGFLITDLSRMLRSEMDRRIAQAGLGLTPGEARTLVHVARGGTTRQSVLAERMGVEAMTLSTFIDRLELRGLVRREADPSDRRAKLVRLTDAADPAIARIAEIGAAIREQALQSFSQEEWDVLKHLLKRARANFADARGEIGKPVRAA